MRVYPAYLAIACVALCAGAPEARAQSISVIGYYPGQACAQVAAAAIKTGKTDRQALQTCTEALRGESLFPGDIAATYVNRGVVEDAMALHDVAIADFRRAIHMNDGLVEAHSDLGVALAADHQPAAAVVEFTWALDLNPQHPELIYFNRAVANEDSSNVKAAYNDYLTAATLAPDWDAPKHELTRFKVQRREA